MRIGITGSIGSGKSTVLSFFKERQFKIIDADALVKELLANDATVIDSIRSHFGDSVFTDDQVDNKALANIVFNDPKELSWLEDLLHPTVIELIRTSMDADPKSNWAVEIPLLFEKNLQDLFDYTFCITVDPKVQEQRLLAKGFSLQEAQQRIAQQLSQDQKAAQANHVLANNGTLEELASRLQAQLDRLG